MNQNFNAAGIPHDSAAVENALVCFSKEEIGADLKPIGDPLDIIDRDITLTAFNAAVVCPIHFDFEREILLAEATRHTKPADIRRQNVSKQTRMGAFHSA